MEIENLWSSVKTFYFRNENVILRVPFCFFLQLGTYFDKIVKESREEDTKTWYETAGTRPSSWSLKISSHTGNVRILEVNPDGNYVRVFNTSSFKVSSLVQAQLQNLESYHQNINLIVNSVV